MPELTVVYGEEIQTIRVSEGSVLGEVIPATGLPLEQPCAGRGTCGKCKVLVEQGVAPPDEIERMHLTPGELALDNRLACRARVQGDARVVLAPIVVYSNKSFRTSHRYKSHPGTLGLAIDLGSTTVAAFLTILEDGEVCAEDGGETFWDDFVDDFGHVEDLECDIDIEDYPGFPDQPGRGQIHPCVLAASSE